MKAKKVFEGVERLIADSLQDVMPTNTMESAFHEFIEKRGAILGIDKVIISSEIDEKVRLLKECEKEDDLGWFDYPSWNLLPTILRDGLVDLTDPLMFDGVFFKRSTLQAVEKEFWRYMPVDLTVFELKDARAYQYVVLGADGSQYDRLGVYAMMEIKRKFQRQTVRTIGMSKGGLIIKVHDKRLK